MHTVREAQRDASILGACQPSRDAHLISPLMALPVIVPARGAIWASQVRCVRGTIYRPQPGPLPHLGVCLAVLSQVLCKQRLHMLLLLCQLQLCIPCCSLYTQKSK